MEIVEYLDETTGKPTGQYAKRFEDGLIDVPREVEVLDKKTGKKSMLTIIEKVMQYRDEVIPKKIFCVCDSVGNIKSVTEENFSYAVEIEGEAHSTALMPGEEANEVLGVDMPIIPVEHADNKLGWLLDNHKMGPKNAQGKRKIKVKPDAV